MSKYCYNRLPIELRESYDSLLASFYAGKSSAIVNKSLTKQSFNALVFALRFDNPELFAIDFGQTPDVQRLGLMDSFEFSFKQLAVKPCEEAEILRVRDSFYRYQGLSDYDKVRAVKQYLADTTGYCHDSLKLSLAGKEFNHRSLTLLGALIDKKAVCEGFTKAAVYLLDYLGVPVGALEGWRRYGDTEFAGTPNHAWNVVKVGESWYNLDISADIKIDAGRGQTVIPDFYFLIDDATMSLSTRIIYGGDCTKLTDNYFVKNGLSFDNLADLRHYIDTFHNIGNTLAFRYTGPEQKARLDSLTINALRRRIPHKSYKMLNERNYCHYYILKG